MNILNQTELILQLLLALIQVESGGLETALGDGNRAYGILQIHQIMAEDCSRISGNTYKHKDAFNPEIAKEMFFIYTTHYVKHIHRTTDHTCTIEDIAILWNAGYSGWQKGRGKGYWRRVRLELDKMNVDYSRSVLVSLEPLVLDFPLFSYT